MSPECFQIIEGRYNPRPSPRHECQMPEEESERLLVEHHIALVNLASMAPDDFALRILYRHTNGDINWRIVSPVRFQDEFHFLALCMAREEPRTFCLLSCLQVDLVAAHEVLMPVPLESFEEIPE